MDRTLYKTVVISDLHLGNPHSKVAEVSNFLSSVDCDTLIMNGDIIDAWELENSKDEKWTDSHSAVFKVLSNMMSRYGTKIIYVIGNHDDILFKMAPVKMFGLSLVNEWFMSDCGHKIAVVHGHAFDTITMRFNFLARLGSITYDALIRFTNMWNKGRARTKKGRYSFSQVLKQGVKKGVQLISGYEKDLEAYAKSHGCDMIIGGHTHHVEDKMLHGVRYLNSGDWMESMTALAQTLDGEWKILYYRDLFDSDNKPRPK